MSFFSCANFAGLFSFQLLTFVCRTPFIESSFDYRNIYFDIRINKDMYAFENCFYSVGILRFRFGCLKREFYEFYISLLAKVAFENLHMF